MALPSVPCRRADWRLMIRTARLVVGIPRYAVVAVVAAVLGLSLFVGSLNPDLVRFALTGDLDPASRVAILANLYPFVGTGFDTLQGALLVGVSLLLGVDVAMATYHVAEHGLSVRGSGGSLLGVVFATLGAGCAACGSAVLLGLLSLLGVSVSLVALPLEGLEFALLALAVLILSIHWLAAGMRGGRIDGCPVDL